MILVMNDSLTPVIFIKNLVIRTIVETKWIRSGAISAVNRLGVEFDAAVTTWLEGDSPCTNSSFDGGLMWVS